WTLLREIQNHPALGDGVHGREFRAELAALQNQFHGQDPAGLVEAAVATLKKHAAGAKAAMESQTSEITAATTELSDVIKALPNTEPFEQRLRTIEQEIDSISPETLDNSKARLRAEVAAARADSVAERQKILEFLSGPMGKLEAASQEMRGSEGALGVRGEGGFAGGTAYALDPLTGLPGRAYAEVELGRSLNETDDYYVALFVIKRLALINAKFGYKRGDQVLMKVATHLAQSVPEFNNLFPWAPSPFPTKPQPKPTYKEVPANWKILSSAASPLLWNGKAAAPWS